MSDDKLHVILWIDDRECSVCGWGQLVVLGPKYGQSNEYVLKCVHCREKN